MKRIWVQVKQYQAVSPGKFHRFLYPQRRPWAAGKGIAVGELMPWHYVVIIVIAILLFGPKKLPEMARSLGEGIREFKKSFSEGMSEEKKPGETAPALSNAPSTETHDALVK